jgi:hypothetical protein
LNVPGVGQLKDTSLGIVSQEDFAIAVSVTPVLSIQISV